MISKHTKPGTKVIYNPKDQVHSVDNTASGKPLRAMPLIVGETYTVAHMYDLREYNFKVPENYRYAIRVFEAPPDQAFTLELFDYPALPECLTSILEGKPFDADLLEETNA